MFAKNVPEVVEESSKRLFFLSGHASNSQNSPGGWGGLVLVRIDCGVIFLRQVRHQFGNHRIEPC